MASLNLLLNGKSGSHSRKLSESSVSGKNKLSFLLNNDETQTSAQRKALPITPSRDGRQGPEHDKLRKFVCETCRFGFYTKSNLKKHISSVHLQLRPFKCPSCDKTFGEKSNATKHYKSVHAREKNAACTQCDAVFAFRDGLVRHVRLVHDGVRSFRCPVPGCRSVAFKQSAHLKKHIATVHKQGS